MARSDAQRKAMWAALKAQAKRAKEDYERRPKFSKRGAAIGAVAGLAAPAVFMIASRGRVSLRGTNTINSMVRGVSKVGKGVGKVARGASSRVRGYSDNRKQLGILERNLREIGVPKKSAKVLRKMTKDLDAPKEIKSLNKFISGWLR